MNPLKNLSFNLRKLRISQALTQFEMSFKIGIDSRLYQKYESENPPNIKLINLCKISTALNVTIDNLIK